MEYTAAIEQQLAAKGIHPAELEARLKRFQTGFPAVKLLRPATPGDGILRLDEKTIENYITYYDQHQNDYHIAKFVPASGAASRMFSALFTFVETGKETEEIRRFFDRIQDFAFYSELQKHCERAHLSLTGNIPVSDRQKIIRILLSSQGMNYGNLPKALLLFHRYSGHKGDEYRTALEEHIIEGIYYADNEGKVHLHFTVSQEHLPAFEKHIREVKESYEKKNNIQLSIELSTQRTSTDQPVVDENKKPLLSAEGTLVFNPGGHGALIENVNSLESEIVFIKNIDNVRKKKFATVRYKKLLGGLLIKLQRQIQSYLTAIRLREAVSVEELFDFMSRQLQIVIPEAIYEADRKTQLDFAFKRLNRPLRIAGMVKNEGEPGGGPFWVEEEEGSHSLQIIEKAQINREDPGQVAIMQQSTHFNPVDLVCYIKDFQGNKFDLMKFRKEDMGFISKKNKWGKEVWIQELPGLWNGAMGDWISVFVEVPLETFSPVKTVLDLLRKEHQ